MKLSTALLAATILAAPAASAFADPLVGPYVGLGAGVTQFMNAPIKNYNSAAGFDYNSYGSTSNDAGWAGAGSIGYGLGNGLRVEIQGLYQDGKLQNWGAGGTNVSGRQQQFGGFGNVLYDINLEAAGIKAPFTPYVGVGIGYAESKYQGGSVYDGNNGGQLNFSSDKGSLAAQAILGASFDVSAFPGLAVTAEYHFVTIPEHLSYSANFDGFGARFRTNGTYAHTALLGIRYAFDHAAPPPPVAAPMAPPPPPPPPVAVVEARTYLVFFDWDRADLTTRAKAIVAEAASASTHVTTTRIEVNGYTDLSGTAAYNQRLSVRRAESVEAELVKDGVPQSEIAIHGYGESNPLVPTAKGVREPQNRRVEIILK